MRSQEMIKYEKMAYARPTLNIFKSDFLFLSDHFRPPGTQNEKKKGKISAEPHTIVKQI